MFEDKRGVLGSHEHRGEDEGEMKSKEMGTRLHYVMGICGSESEP